MANILKRFQNSILKLIAPDERVLKYSTSYGSRYIDPRYKAFCHIDINQEPNTYLPLYQYIYRSFPFFKKADDVKQYMIGTVDVTHENINIQKQINDDLNNIPIYSFKDTNTPIGHGIDTLNASLMRTAHRDGIAFGEISYIENTNEINGIILYDSIDFRFIQTSVDDYQLYYTRNGANIKIEENENFIIYRNEIDPKYLWSPTLIDGSEFFSEVLLKMVVSRKNLHLRVGAPPTINVVGVDTKESGMRNDHALKFKEMIDKLSGLWKNAVSEMDKGKSVDIFAGIPANVKLNSSTLGQGINGISEWNNDFNTIAKHAVSVTGVPAELIGFDSGSAGIGSDKFMILYDMLKSSVANQAIKLDKVTKQITDAIIYNGNYGSSALSYELDRTLNNYIDQKQVAETEEISARATAQELLNFTELVNNSDNYDRANAYAEEIGRPEWKI